MSGEDQQNEIRHLARLALLLQWGSAGTFIALLLTMMGPVPATVGVGCLVFIAAFAGGAGLGFIFGVPRAFDGGASSAPETVSAVDGGSAAAGATGNGKRLLSGNTSLERISEWLATMIVGVGLSQLHNVNTYLVSFRNFLDDIAPKTMLPAAGPLLLIAGTASGFLFMYLYTRLLLPRSFRDAEQVYKGDLPASQANVVRRAAAAASSEAMSDGQSSDAELNSASADAVPRAAQSSASTARKDAVARATRAAIDKVSQTAKPSINDALSLMVNLLYRGDYQRVIELSGELGDSAAAKRAEFWLYTAAAYGQLHHALLIGDGDPTAREAAKHNALEAARRAVEIDPGMRDRLWQIALPGGVDDDLQDFRELPEFRAIVGRRLD